MIYCYGVSEGCVGWAVKASDEPVPDEGIEEASSATDDATTKYVALPSTRGRFVKLRGLSEVQGRPFMSAAEVGVDLEESPK